MMSPLGANLPAERPQDAGHPKLTAQQYAALAKAEREADIIQDALFAASMAGAISASNGVSSSGFKVFLERLLKQAGNPTDPVERMMIEQLALAHHRIAQLHVQAAEADTVDAAKQYTAMAIRLTGELRRMSLAIKQYRQPTSTKHFTVVRQQNVSAGDQQVAYLDQSTKEAGQSKDSFLPDGSEQGSKRLSHEQPRTLPIQSQTGRGWTPEPEVARTVDRNGASEAPGSGPPKPPLGAIDGAANG